MFDFALFMVFPALMAFAGASDFLTMTISNRLCLTAAAVFFPVAALAGLGGGEIALHASCGLAALGLGIVLFSFGWAGGGDAKLFAVAALWFGWDQIAVYSGIAAIAGGALALLYLIVRVFPAGVPFWPGMRLRNACRTEIPYGIALAAAALALYPHSVWVKALALSGS